MFSGKLWNFSFSVCDYYDRNLMREDCYNDEQCNEKCMRDQRGGGHCDGFRFCLCDK